MSSQKKAFLETEGDAWFGRNRYQDDKELEIIVSTLKTYSITPTSILEIGCASGSQLQRLEQIFGAQCYGIDPSRNAIEHGRKTYPSLILEQGTADELGFPDNYFDLVIFGFCLYLCDPIDHFRIASQADRVLRDGGFLIIKDFISTVPYRSAYSHKVGVYSYKMEWADMFAWNPTYQLLSRHYFEHVRPYAFKRNERASIDLIRKDSAHGFLDCPY